MKTLSCIYPELSELLRQHLGCVLATVVHSQGSTPQKAGSSALIGAGGLIAGTVGGGMTEMKVIELSKSLLKSKKSGLYAFELYGEIAQGSESICGGSMSVLLDTSPGMHLPVFEQLRNTVSHRQKGVLMTLVNTSDPENLKISLHWFEEGNHLPFGEGKQKNLEPAMNEMLLGPMVNSCRTVYLEEDEKDTGSFAFLQRIVPKPSLVIAGAGHIGQALAHLGKFLGFEVTVWDDRPEYANQSMVRDADIVLTGTIDSALEQMAIHEDSYLVVVTRGHKNDAEVLRKFIGLGAAYIGMIGSKAKVNQMKISFLANGWATPGQWNKMYTPIGLSIGAQTVEEIAVSIAAQLVQVRNQRKIAHE